MVKSIENLAKRKPTGGKKVSSRGRRAYEKDKYAAETVLGPDERQVMQVRGGKLKASLKKAEFAVISDPASKTARKVKITKVLSNPANKDYQRRRVITKGAMIETELGKAKVVSRPGQDGTVNAIPVS